MFPSHDPWGSDSGDLAGQTLRLWFADNFGEDLVFNIADGSIYYWDATGGVSTRAVELSSLAGSSDAPVVARKILVSDVDRHILFFGANTIGGSTSDPLLVRWSDKESAIDWTPTSTNQAGGVQLSQGSTIIGALRTRQEILIWTDVGIVSMRFVGEPFIFSFSEVAQGPSLISPNAAVNANNRV